MPKRDKKTSHGDEQFFLMALRNGPLTREEISITTVHVVVEKPG
jgi:hypothetical protein